MNNRLFALLGLATLGFTYFSLQLLFAVYPPEPMSIKLNGHVNKNELLEAALQQAHDDNKECLNVINVNKKAYEEYQRATRASNQRLDEYYRALDQRDERIRVLNEHIQQKDKLIDELHSNNADLRSTIINSRTTTSVE